MNEQADSGSPPPAPPGHGPVPAAGGPASVPHAGERPIHATLSMLEDKLRRLEQDLATVAAGDHELDAPTSANAPDPADAPDPPDAPDVPAAVNAPDPGVRHALTASAGDLPPRNGPGALAATPHATLVDEGRLGSPPSESFPPPPPAPAHARSTSPTEHLGELLRFRDQLDRYARALVTDYERLLEHLGAVIPNAAVARAATPDAGQEQQTQRGSITVDAGPFADVAAVTELHRALESVENVLDCILISFEDRRASLHVRLTGPIPLVRELRRVPGPAFTVLEAAPDRLSLLLGRDAEGVDVGGR